MKNFAAIFVYGFQLNVDDDVEDIGGGLSLPIFAISLSSRKNYYSCKNRSLILKSLKWEKWEVGLIFQYSSFIRTARGFKAKLVLGFF